jgi:hypothetical protein
MDLDFCLNPDILPLSVLFKNLYYDMQIRTPTVRVIVWKMARSRELHRGEEDRAGPFLLRDRQKILLMYVKERKRMTTPRISFMALAGKYFCTLTPQYIPRKPAYRL